jgi:hypothetical protein
MYAIRSVCAWLRSSKNWTGYGYAKFEASGSTGPRASGCDGGGCVSGDAAGGVLAEVVAQAANPALAQMNPNARA